MRTAITSIIALTLCSASAHAGLIFYDAALEFSSSSNPNDAWSYGFSGTATGPLTLFTNPQNRFEPAQLPGWARDAAPATSSLPAVFHNPSTSPVPVADYPAPVDPGALVVHPGDLADEDFVFVRFTAPATASYNISASFEALDTTTGVQALVITNQSTILHDQTFSGFGTVNVFGTPDVIPLNSGDTIDFVVGHAGNYVNDSVQLQALVTQVPAPATLALLAPFAAWRPRRS